MTAGEMYDEVLSFLRSRGWDRVEKGENWWWKEGKLEETFFGFALEECLKDEGIDPREDPPDMWISQENFS